MEINGLYLITSSYIELVKQLGGKYLDNKGPSYLLLFSRQR